MIIWLIFSCIKHDKGRWTLSEGIVEFTCRCREQIIDLVKIRSAGFVVTSRIEQRKLIGEIDNWLDGVLDKSEQIITKTLFIDRDRLNDNLISGAHINLSIIKWKRGNLSEAIEEIEEVYESGFRSTVMYGTLGCY